MQPVNWADTYEIPQWNDTVEIPKFEDTTEIVDERPPEREPATFVEPPPIPEMPVAGPVEGLGAEDIPPGMSAGLPPRPTEAQWEQARKQSKLGEDIAGTMADAEIVGNAERAINLAQDGLISPRVAEMALAVGAPAMPSGIRRSLAEAGSGLTSPVNAGLMLATGAGSAIPKIGGAVARGVAGGFAADIATHMPELGTVAGEASVTGTPEEQQKAFTDVGLSALMGGLAGAGTLHRAAPARPAIPPRIVETIAKADAVGLTKSAQALADTVKESQQRAATIEVEAKVEPATKGETDAQKMQSKAIQEDVRQGAASDRVSGTASARPVTATAPTNARVGTAPGDVGGTPPEVTPPREAPPAPAPVEAAAEVPLADRVSAMSPDEFKQASRGEFREGGFTTHAVRMGKEMATPEGVAKLRDLEAKAKAEFDRALEADDLEAVSALSAQKQFFSEALEGATGAGEFKQSNPVKFREMMEAARKPDEKAIPATTEATTPAAADQTRIPARQAPVVEPRVGGVPENVPAAAFFERESEVAGLGRSSLPPTVADVRAQRARDAATPDTIETQAVDPQSGAPVAPPANPPGKPPTKPAAAAPEPAKATLDDVYKIFEPAPKEGKGIGQRVGDAVESFRTGFSSKFRPLNKLAEDIAAKVGGKARDVAGIFEQLKGSSGKAEADVYRFDKDVSDLVKGSEKDFNAYVFLRRSLDRLQQDAADITRAQAGENVPKLNRRRVSQYTIPQLEAKLTALSEQIGGEKLAQFNKAAEGFQTHMDQALRLQMESGRMAPEVYDAIKAGNQFYAPFKVMKYIEETVKPEGSGRKVDTVADFTKAMEGIDDPNVKLGDMLAAARQNLTLSRTLAEKNRAMQNITELAALDVDGNFVQKLKPGAEAPKGLRAVNVLENGQKQRYAVNENVAEAIDALGPRSANLLMRLAATTFRAGATTFNLPFQISNILADTPRAALISKYGINIVPELALYPFDIAYAKAKGLPVEQINKRLAQSAAQSLRFPLSLLEGIYSSFTGDVVGVKNKLMLDFLDSGAAGTTFQEYMTPGALRQPKTTTGSKTLDAGKNVLKTPLEIAQAVEQINKVAGVKQAMKSHGVESGKALPPDAITELRRFSGSPDFGRMGKWVENYGLNLAQMFLNARIQGLVADAGRLAGRDGMRQAASTWINLGAWVGLPSLYLYMLNNRDEEAQKNYAERPKQEKQNYWLVPKTDDNGKQRYIKGSNGEQVPDYWRIPKRESAKWTGNFVEAGLDFAKDQNPETFKNWSVGLLEDMSPLNVQGKTLTERVESVASGLNPMLKAPIETGTGRDTYRHRNIVPDSQKKASPEQQFTDRTPEIFKSLADAMPDVAPEVFRSPLMLENMTKNFTASLLTQFLPRQPVEGRSAAENLPLTQRFQAVPYTDSSEFDQRIQKFERESADEQLKRLRDAKAILDTNKGAKPDVLIREMIKKHGRDEKLAERIVDLYAAEQRGITPQERRVLALPVTQRAEYLADELMGKTPEQKSALLRNWALKRILTDRVAVELAPKLKPVTP